MTKLNPISENLYFAFFPHILRRITVMTKVTKKIANIQRMLITKVGYETSERDRAVINTEILPLQPRCSNEADRKSIGMYD